MFNTNIKKESTLVSFTRLAVTDGNQGKPQPAWLARVVEPGYSLVQAIVPTALPRRRMLSINGKATKWINVRVIEIRT